MSISMTVEERGASEAFLGDLREKYAQVKKTVEITFDFDVERYREAAGELRRLYREIKEVEYALLSGKLPF